MKNNLSLPITLAVSTLLLTACATPQSSRVEAEFGEAVREMVMLQTLYPEASERNSGAVSKTADGVTTEQVLDAYRKRVTTPETVGSDITINVGSK